MKKREQKVYVVLYASGDILGVYKTRKRAEKAFTVFEKSGARYISEQIVE